MAARRSRSRAEEVPGIRRQYPRGERASKSWRGVTEGVVPATAADVGREQTPRSWPATGDDEAGQGAAEATGCGRLLQPPRPALGLFVGDRLLLPCASHPVGEVNEG